MSRAAVVCRVCINSVSCLMEIGDCLLGVYSVSYIRLVGGYTHTVKGDTFYFGYDIYKLLTCRSDGIA